MNERLAEQLSEALKTTPLDEPDRALTGHQVAGLAHSRGRRRRAVACVAGAVATMVVVAGIGLTLRTGGGRGATTPVGSPISTPQTFEGSQPGGSKLGPPLAQPRLNLIWPGGRRPQA